MQMINDLPFWRHPRNGWSEETRGLSHAKLDLWEQTIGFALPNRFRELMAEQNGGSLRQPTLHRAGDEPWEITIDSSPVEESKPYTLRDLLRSTWSEKELDVASANNGVCYPERAILISTLHGHECLVLDYGWQEEQPRPRPRVAILTEYGNEFPYEEVWSVPDFDSFLKELGPTEDDGKRALGLACEHSFEDVGNVFKKWVEANVPTEVTVEPKGAGFRAAVPLEITDEIEAIYCRNYSVTPKDFSDWLGAEGRRRWITAHLFPNEFSAGAWHFPEHPEITACIEIARTWFETEPALPQLGNELRAIDGLGCSKVIELKR
ncbi:MAG: SMI1/KNR4 family protein [Filomicrobium sp.]